MTDPLAIDWINSSEIVVTRDGAAVVKVGQAYAGTTPVAAAVVVETTRPTKPAFGQSISWQIGPPQVVSGWNRTTGAWIELDGDWRAIAQYTGDDGVPHAWPNILSGAVGNSIAGSVYPGTSGGDGRSNVILGGGGPTTPNTIAGPDPVLCTIIAGYDNTITGQLADSILASQHSILHVGAEHSTIVGGSTNQIGAVGVSALSTYSIVLAGSFNVIGPNSSYSTIVAGTANTVEGDHSAVIAGTSSTLGTYGTNQGNYSAIVAGASHTIGTTTTATHSVIAGGITNKIDGTHSAVIAGTTNQTKANHSLIAGGTTNIIEANSDGASSIGGRDNLIGDGVLGNTDAIIAGGSTNQVGLTSASPQSGVFAGARNHVNATRSAIVGGEDNVITVSATRSVILGGDGITATRSHTAYVNGLHVKAAVKYNSDALAGAGGLVTGDIYQTGTGHATLPVGVMMVKQ